MYILNMHRQRNMSRE